MKETVKKMAEMLKLIFGYSIMITLFAGGLIFFGYLAALIIGGDTAAAICAFIYQKIIPVMIYVSTVTVLLGLLAMYLAGEKSLTSGKRNKKSEKSGK